MNAKRIALLAAFCLVGLMVEQASAYYHAPLGRFVNRDPGGQPGFASSRVGTGFEASSLDGQFIVRDHPAVPGYVDGFNLYAYVDSNPISSLDPSGLKKVNTGIKRCRGYQKGHALWSWFSIHGFIGVDGVGYGFFEEDLNVCGTGDMRDDDFGTYPESDPGDVESGQFYSVCSDIYVDDRCFDPQKFADTVRQCIKDRQADPGCYCAGCRDCNSFASGCLRKARQESRKQPASRFCSRHG